MKIVKVSFLLIIAFLLTTLNIYSQLGRASDLINSGFTFKSPSNERKFDANILKTKSIENQLNKANHVQVFDSTSLVDSIFVGSREKHFYTYESNGNVLSHLCKLFDGSQWIISFNYSYKYDSNGKLTYNLREGTSKYSSTYTYDLDENLTLEFVEIFDNNEWKISQKYIYTYDANGYRTSFLFEQYYYGNLNRQGRHTYTYDSNGNMTSLTKERWFGEQLVNNTRDNYTYDSNGNIASIYTERWENEWLNWYKYTYTYDSYGNMTVNFKEWWDGTKWYNVTQSTYIFDSAGDLSLDLFEKWEDNTWVKDLQHSYVYDAYRNIISDIYERWNGTAWDINYNYRFSYIYDSHGNMTSKAFEYFLGNEWHTDNYWLNFYDSFGRYYEFSSSKIDIYYRIITDIEETHLDVLDYNLSQNYPNPFNPSTTIKYEIPDQTRNDNVFVQLKVYDVLGREVAILVNKEQSAGNYEVQFNASSLTSGIYLYKLQSGSFVESRKMILIR